MRQFLGPNQLKINYIVEILWLEKVFGFPFYQGSLMWGELWPACWPGQKQKKALQQLHHIVGLSQPKFALNVRGCEACMQLLIARPAAPPVTAIQAAQSQPGANLTHSNMLRVGSKTSESGFEWVSIIKPNHKSHNSILGSISGLDSGVRK